MKKIILLIAVFFMANVFGQNINTFDENGRRHGKWKKHYEGTKNLRYQGQFNHGKEIGVFEFYHKEPKGKHPSCIKEYTPGSNVVFVKYYTSKGVFLSEGKMKGKQRIGKWSSYERNTGVLIENELYENGKLNGVKTSYYEDGKVLQTQEFKNDMLHGEKILYAPNGKLTSKYLFVNGKTDGPFVEYDKSGQKSLTGKYKMDKPQGVWKYYENGKLVKKKDYTLSSNPGKKKKKVIK